MYELATKQLNNKVSKYQNKGIKIKNEYQDDITRDRCCGLI